MKNETVVIIGAGPSGIATAIQLKRYNISQLLLEKGEIGGMLKNANLVENYPGFPGGIKGEELVQLFKNQVDAAQVNVLYENVQKVVYENQKFTLFTEQRSYRCRILVVATGTNPKKLSDILISEREQKHIFYDITAIKNVSNNHITIIGAGDLAFDYALNLSRKNTVTMINRGEKVKCLPLLWERAESNKNISYIKNAHVKEITTSDHESILTYDNSTRKHKITTQHLVVAIGREPNMDFLGDYDINALHTAEKKKQLYMVGDVVNRNYRQTAIAVGDGIKTAMRIHKYLEKDGNENHC